MYFSEGGFPNSNFDFSQIQKKIQIIQGGRGGVKKIMNFFNFLWHFFGGFPNLNLSFIKWIELELGLGFWQYPDNGIWVLVEH